MRRKWHAPAFILVSLILVVAMELPYGCRKNDDPLSADTTGGGEIPDYGRGSVSFIASGGGGAFAVTGPYVPSDEFLDDTAAGQGAGGFVRDTSLFGNRIKGLFSAYMHAFQGGVASDRVIVLLLNSSSDTLTTGDYAFSGFSTPAAGNTAYVYFNLTNSKTPNPIFEADSGMITLSLIDRSSRHVQGTFSGALKNLTDTSTVQLMDGRFDILYSANYFNF